MRNTRATDLLVQVQSLLELTTGCVMGHSIHRNAYVNGRDICYVVMTSILIFVKYIVLW